MPTVYIHTNIQIYIIYTHTYVYICINTDHNFHLLSYPVYTDTVNKLYDYVGMFIYQKIPQKNHEENKSTVL